MKVRNGFVSNSSSSSFVLIGKKITIKEAKKAKKKPVIIFDGWGCDGIYACVLDKEMLEYLSSRDKEVNGTLYDAFYFGEEDHEISTKGIPSKVSIIGFERDQGSPYCLSDLVDLMEKHQ